MLDSPLADYVLWVLYFAPLIVTILRRWTNRPTGSLWQVIFLDVLCGWTVVGWLVSWVFVFPTLNALVAGALLRMFGRGAGGGAAPPARQPGPADESGSPDALPCFGCNGSRVQPCPQCQGRGSWWEQPQTASGVAQLVQCTYCISSGRVTCQTCGGSGRR